MNLTGDWEGLRVTGLYYQTVKVEWLGPSGGSAEYKSNGGAVQGKWTSSAIPLESYALWTAIANDDSNGESKRGHISLLGLNESSNTKWEQPVIRVKERGSADQFRRRSLLNARLIKTLFQQVDVSNSGSGDTNLFSYTLAAYGLSAVGEETVLRCSGEFASNANSKEIAVKFRSTEILSHTGNYSGKKWKLTARSVRVTSNDVYTEATLLIDGESPIIDSVINGSTWMNIPQQWKVVGNGDATNDITMHYGKLTWQQEATED